MPILTCKINLFDLDQSIYLQKDDGTQELIMKVPFDHFSKAIVPLCYKQEVYELDIIGSHKFIQGLKEDIEKRELKKYNQNKIEIKERTINE